MTDNDDIHSTASSDDVKAGVRRHYGREAAATARAEVSGCCGGGTPVSLQRGAMYDPQDLAVLPQDATRATWGSGNPVAFADMQPGETVLDLGSGGGLDCLLAAEKVGPSGRVIGIDMTDEMLALARSNAARAAAANVEFRKGELEALPLPDASVDVVISNCVINLSPDKDTVLAEAWRVLRPGGRFVVSDIVLITNLPDQMRTSRLWCECIAGALREEDFLLKTERAGFVDVHIVPDGSSDYVPGVARSVLVRARKPGALGERPRAH